jgi:hypothetical protein
LTETIEEYDHDCKIVREGDGADAQWHYEGPLGRVKSFPDPDKARLYADVQGVTGGFREEKTGERGVPPGVARAREDVLMAYMVSNPSMGVTYVARAFDVVEDVVRDYCQMVRDRAADQREEDNADA